MSSINILKVNIVGEITYPTIENKKCEICNYNISEIVKIPKNDIVYSQKIYFDTNIKCHAECFHKKTHTRQNINNDNNVDIINADDTDNINNNINNFSNNNRINTQKSRTTRLIYLDSDSEYDST
jgi:hypothetical protein